MGYEWKTLFMTSERCTYSLIKIDLSDAYKASQNELFSAPREWNEIGNVCFFLNQWTFKKLFMVKW